MYTESSGVWAGGQVDVCKMDGGTEYEYKTVKGRHAERLQSGEGRAGVKPNDIQVHILTSARLS